jgi:hypothetical protein
MKRALSTVTLTLLTAFMAACGSIQTIPYSPQPSRIKNPVAETKTLIVSNTLEGCIAQPELDETMLVVTFACTRRGVGNSVLRFDRVAGIELQRSNDWYRVLVHQNGAPDFTWSSKSKSDMQRLADALTALSKPRDARSAPGEAQRGSTSL